MTNLTNILRNVFYTSEIIILFSVAVLEVTAPSLLCDLLYTSPCDANSVSLVRIISIPTAFWGIHTMLYVNYPYGTILACMIAFGSAVLFAYTVELEMLARVFIGVLSGLLAVGYAFFDVYQPYRISRLPAPPALEPVPEEGIKRPRSRRDILNVA